MFLAPVFLIAAGIGAAIPFILHLMQNRRRSKLMFPTLRFLQKAQKNTSRRIRLENFVLWLLRTLIMLSLGSAFAMPMVRNGGLAWLGDKPRDVAIVLDASYSMGYQVDRAAVWDKAIEAAVAVLEGLREPDRFCIYLAREQPEAIVAEPVSDKQEGVARLRALELGTSESRILPAVNAAMKALLKADTQREREIHIITDNQALPWRPLASGGTEADLEAKTAVFVSLLGVSAPENTGIVSFDLQPPVARQGSEMRALFKLHHAGVPKDSTVSLFIDDREISRKYVPAGETETAQPSFTIPALEAGVHTARIQTPVDNLAADNPFYFLIRVQEPMPSLVVGVESETLFLRTALRTGLGGTNAVEAIPPQKVIDQPLSRYGTVILCNALPLFGQAITAIESYVKAGGVLVVFPGTAAKSEAYAPWSCLPALPRATEEIPLPQRNRTLTWDQSQNPLVRTLREGIGIPTIAVRRKLTFDALPDGCQRVVSMGPNQPFLLSRQFGSGHVVLFAVSADRTWSDFPLSPFFLPLLLQCADLGVGAGPKAPFEWATDWLPLSDRFPEWKSPPNLSGPDGQPVSIRSSVVDGRTVLDAEKLSLPGFYTMDSAGQADAKPVIAVNLLRRESDLSPVAEGDIPKQLGVDKTVIAHDLDALRNLIFEHRIGRTFGEHLLWLALALIAIEFVYANVLGRVKEPRADSQGTGLPFENGIGSQPLKSTATQTSARTNA
jgi:hypothetical protein